MAFVPNVQAHKQCSNLLKDARVFQLSAIDGADAGNLSRKISRKLQGIRVVAADDDVAVESFIPVEKFGGQIVKGRDHAHSLGHEFRSLLCGMILAKRRACARRVRQRLRQVRQWRR